MKIKKYFTILLLSLGFLLIFNTKVSAICQCDLASQKCVGDTCGPAKGVFCNDYDDLVCITPPDDGSCYCKEFSAIPGTYRCSNGCVEANTGLTCQNDAQCQVLGSPTCTICSLLDTLGKVILPWIAGIGVFFTIIFLAIGGIKYTTSKDDPKKLAEAKGTIAWAIIGFIIIILAAAIIRMFWVFFGFSETDLFFIPNDDPIRGIDCSLCD